ncbi:hypothetical protein D6D25_09011 [Aureobasidium pullulans]|nr:hypothetical protein D6D25_09011 [Aureobasidium pullulans]
MVYLDHLNAKALGRIVSYRRESFSVITWQGSLGHGTQLLMTGVFFYVYPGIASTASFLLNETNPAFGSLLQVGFAFGFGIAFAIITCGSTSGGQVIHSHCHASI